MKYIGASNALLAGVLTFVFFSLTNYINVHDNFTGWDLLANSSNATGVIVFKAFGIASLAFACVAIIWGFFLLLKDLNVIKVRVKMNYTLITNVILILLGLCVWGAFIGLIIIRASAINISSAYVGVGAWLMFCIDIAICIFNWIITKERDKYAK